jgi:hypothetical protein
MKLRYNDGLGKQDIVAFLGTNFVEDMRLKCKIRLSNDAVILVIIETLNFIENLDSIHSRDSQRLFLRKHRYFTFSIGTHFASQSTITAARGDDEPSHLIASCTYSTVRGCTHKKLLLCWVEKFTFGHADMSSKNVNNFLL